MSEWNLSSAILHSVISPRGARQDEYRDFKLEATHAKNLSLNRPKLDRCRFSKLRTSGSNELDDIISRSLRSTTATPGDSRFKWRRRPTHVAHHPLTAFTMSTITRTLRNLWRVGFKEYGHQIQYMVDEIGEFTHLDVF